MLAEGFKDVGRAFIKLGSNDNRLEKRIETLENKLCDLESDAEQDQASRRRERG